MQNILLGAQIIVSVVLIIFILLQQRGTALGSAFGAGESGGFYATRRGVQKKIFIATIIFGVLFIALALASVLLF